MNPMPASASADQPTRPHRAGASTAAGALLDTVALYLHIPFCHVKCHYCDFNTYAGVLRLREPFVDALRDDILLSGQRARRADGSPRRCRTVYFGGGTPSLLTPEQVRGLLDAASAAFHLDADAEISLEANPGALEYSHLDELRTLGVNRLSMGAQSFDAGLLRWMGRIHSPEDVEAAFRAGRATGLANINLDFMYALPGQSLDTWSATLDRAVALAPDHLSLYSLIVEEHTPLHRWVSQGKVQPADEDTAAEMYELAVARLAAAGYLHYEISNWARPGAECRHNLTYWHNLPYIGLGAGAHSWYAGHRFVEVRSIREYTTQVAAAVAAAHHGVSARGALPAAAIVEDEAIGQKLEMAETAMLRLRLTEGLPLEDFAGRFGCTFEGIFGEPIAEVMALGLIEIIAGVVRLTPRGMLLGNEVFARLLPDATA